MIKINKKANAVGREGSEGWLVKKKPGASKFVGLRCLIQGGLCDEEVRKDARSGGKVVKMKLVVTLGF